MDQRNSTSRSGQSARDILAAAEKVDPIDALTWTLDDVGSELIERSEIRDQLQLLMVWPGRVSGWRRSSHFWLTDPAHGTALIFGIEGGQGWRWPGSAVIDPLSVVGNGVSGSPPAMRSVTLLTRKDLIVVAAINTATQHASLMEMTPAPSLPGASQLMENFPVARGDAIGFDVRGEIFDNVRPASIYAVNAGLSLESAVLLVDSTGAPRAWMRAEHFGDVPPTLGISRDNARIVDSTKGAVTSVPSAYQLGEMRRVVRAAEASAPRHDV